MRPQDTWTKPGPGGRRIKTARHGVGLRWRVRYLEHGERRTASFRTRDAAQAWIDRYERPVVVGDVTVGALLPAARAAKAHRAAATLAQHDSVVRSQVKPRWGEVKVGDVSADAIRAWLAGLDLSASRRSHCLGALRAALSVAVERGDLPVDPSAGISVSGRQARREAGS